MKKHNFSSGPAILPVEVFEEASKAVIEYDDLGLSILEISHRSNAFQSILEESETLIREILEVPESHAILFLTGGASSQFYMTSMNLLNPNEVAHFIDTGAWSIKAIKEAKKFGLTNVIASSEDQKYSYIPKNYEIPTTGKYLHITSNNTIYGTQFHHFPDISLPLICDMSSDIFSRPIDVSKFDLIYAGAQKNLGPAGTTLVIVNKAILGQVERDIPSMLDYRSHIAKNSAFNTPPVYPIYVSLLTLRWLKKNGGVVEMRKKAKARAKLFYETLDSLNCFKGLVRKEDRSLMNATFSMEDTHAGHYDSFLQFAESANCSGIKGHRSVGGFRASMYNAMEISSVKVLTNIMREFAAKIN